MFLRNSTKTLNNYFVDTDSKENLEKNLKNLPNDWRYKNKKIFYNLNDLKYRTKEFKDIDWQNSIVLFGCSTVFGTGLAEDEILSAQLEQHTGIPTINMGVNGSSIYFSYYNQIHLYKNYALPKAVINVWTDIHRLTYFDEVEKNHNLGPWTSDNFKKNLYTSWNLNNRHALEFAKMITYSAKTLWSKIPYYECSFFLETSDSLNIQLLPTIDYARDLLHPGWASMSNAARIILKNLNLP